MLNAVIEALSRTNGNLRSGPAYLCETVTGFSAKTVLGAGVRIQISPSLDNVTHLKYRDDLPPF